MRGFIVTGVNRRMRWAGHVVWKGDMINICKILDGEPKRKKLPGRNRQSCDGNIKMILK
jgi:hypothetical protein